MASKPIIFHKPLPYVCKVCRVLCVLSAGELREHETEETRPPWIIDRCPVCKDFRFFINPLCDYGSEKAEELYRLC